MKSEQKKNSELLDKAYDLLWQVYAEHRQDDTFGVQYFDEDLGEDFSIYAKVKDLLDIINKLDNLMGR